MSDVLIAREWLADGSVVDHYGPPEAPPDRVSLRQLLIGLTAGGWITQTEAMAAAQSGAAPAALETVLAGMAAADAFAARLTWASMVEALRTDPLWTAFVASGIATEAQIDDLFRYSAQV